jgi:hypothetical protein
MPAAAATASRWCFDRVEIGRLPAPPVPPRILGDQKADRGALVVVPVRLDEDPARLAEARGRNAPRLVEEERVEQAHDERRPQVRLVLDKGVRERELRGGRLGDPGRELRARAQRQVHAFVEVVPHQVGRRLPVEGDDRVVLGRKADGDSTGAGGIRSVP